jgi:hypothetical protein
VTPAPLSDQERSGSGPKFGSQESVRLTEGAWVQVADAKGNLKQQYTAARIDPLPDKRLSMDAPRAVLYGEGGRIVTMRGDTMTARVPRRELESGRLAGNVVIRIYRPRDGRPVDLRADAPEVVVECPEASFDAESGEVRCDRQVRILGDSVSFDGEGLSMTVGRSSGSWWTVPSRRCGSIGPRPGWARRAVPRRVRRCRGHPCRSHPCGTVVGCPPWRSRPHRRPRPRHACSN